RAAHAGRDGQSRLYGNADSGASARKVTKRHCRRQRAASATPLHSWAHFAGATIMSLNCVTYAASAGRRVAISRHWPPVCKAPIAGAATPPALVLWDREISWASLATAGRLRQGIERRYDRDPRSGTSKALRALSDPGHDAKARHSSYNRNAAPILFLRRPQ